MNFKKIHPIIILVVLVWACSSVQSLYIQDGYNENPGGMIKRVILLAGAPGEYSNIVPLMINIAADVLELKKNYLVYKSGSFKNTWNRECGKINGIKLDGAILFTLEHIEASEGIVNIMIKGEIFRCGIDDLLWNATAGDEVNSINEDLLNLTMVYKEKFGDVADVYAAPIFTLVQDLVKTMPDPVLTEDEEMEKIELEAYEDAPLPWFEQLAFVYR